MSPFWTSLGGALRGRGKNGTLFIAVVLPLVGAVLFSVQLPREIYHHYILPAFGALAAAVVLVLVRRWRLERARRQAKLEAGTLSRDELEKARSKLVKDQVRRFS